MSTLALVVLPRLVPLLRLVIFLPRLALLVRSVVRSMAAVLPRPLLLQSKPFLRTVLSLAEPAVLRLLAVVLLRTILSLRTVPFQQLVVPLLWEPCLRSVASPTSLSSPLITG